MHRRCRASIIHNNNSSRNDTLLTVVVDVCPLSSSPRGRQSESRLKRHSMRDGWDLEVSPRRARDLIIIINNH
eukprot:scaffold11454_cov168-Amphora_coffeaeformis.AAC.19